MIAFLRRIISFFICRSAEGYRCDSCKRWTPRREGMAKVVLKHPGVNLYCPACAEILQHAIRQTKD